MNNPKNLKYSESHEWVRLDGEYAIIGITDFAQSELGDVVFVDLPEEEDDIQAGEEFGEVESTKAVSELKSPLSGSVVSYNETLDEDYSVINSDPYGKGWLIKVKLTNLSELDSLMSSAEYSEQVS